jgi:hypothetical protein
VREQDEEVTAQGITLAVTNVFDLLNEVRQVQLLPGAFPQARGLRLRPSI